MMPHRALRCFLLGPVLFGVIPLLLACTQQEREPTPRAVQPASPSPQEKPGAAAKVPSPVISPAAKPAVSPATSSPSPSPSPSPRAQAAASPALATGPVTDIPFDQVDRLAALVGRPVQLSNVQVQGVMGDRLFWIGPNQNQWVPVFLDEEAQTLQTPTEGKVDLSPGQMVNIMGELRRMPPTEQLQQQFDAPPQVLRTVADLPAYIHAQNVEIVSR